MTAKIIVKEGRKEGNKERKGRKNKEESRSFETNVENGKLSRTIAVSLTDRQLA